jgi:hypothetical protein
MCAIDGVSRPGHVEKMSARVMSVLVVATNEVILFVKYERIITD